MLQPLPAETVFEAKRRSRRNTRLLFGLLLALYVVFFNLMGLVVIGQGTSDPASLLREWPGDALDGSPLVFFTVAAAVAAGIHFLWASSKSLPGILKALDASPADEKDDIHKRLINVVKEVEIAVGLSGIQPVVISTTAMNAFSIEDGSGKKAIGATEGLLGKLSRPELEAVIAHEAAHLAHGDSRVMATACALFAVFAVLAAALRPGRVRRSSRGGGGVVIVLWLLVAIAHFLTRLVSMAISRNREYMADSHGVHMCKDPLALADALKKISTGDRGTFLGNEGFSAVFILRPDCAAIEEKEGFAADLFSTHPPVAHRIEKLLQWARQTGPAPASSVPGSGVYVRQESNGSWQGPVPAGELVGNSAILPTSWIADATGLKHASQEPELYAEFVRRLGAKSSGHACPRCDVPLASGQYEGMPVLECEYCKGRLLYPGGIERAIARRLEAFDGAAVVQAKAWRAVQKGRLKDLCKMPHIDCPLCGQRMNKLLHTELTRVVIDRCSNKDCDVTWCDGGEIERIQVLVEHVV